MEKRKGILKKKLFEKSIFFFNLNSFLLKTLDYYICEQEKFEKLAETDEYEHFYREKLDSIRKK
jgi:hypothetical protein